MALVNGHDGIVRTAGVLLCCERALDALENYGVQRRDIRDVMRVFLATQFSAGAFDLGD
jgi:uncharacterized protein YcgI (DUF1989 family)